MHSDNWDKRGVCWIFFAQLSCTSEMFRLQQPTDSVSINISKACVIRTLNLKILFCLKLSSNVNCCNWVWQKQQSCYFHNRFVNWKKKISKALCCLEAYLATNFRTVKKTVQKISIRRLQAKDQGFFSLNYFIIIVIIPKRWRFSLAVLRLKLASDKMAIRERARRKSEKQPVHIATGKWHSSGFSSKSSLCTSAS